MQIRKFSANDTRSAMRLVRTELGDDAVILSTRQTGDGVELVSASGYDEDLVKHLVREPKGGATPSSESAPQSEEDTAALTLTETVQDLRTLLERAALRDEAATPARASPLEAARGAQLRELGFSPAVIARLLAAMPSSPTYQLTESLLHDALDAPLDWRTPQALEQGGAIVVMGPTGVGKTTTVGKLAVRLAMRHSTDEIALISTDGHRLGAHHQLQSLGRLLAIPVFEVDALAELQSLLPSLASRRWILIDTAGSGDTGAASRELAGLLAQNDIPMTLLLTLAANTQREALAATLRAYQAPRPHSIALTKTDECVALAPALSTIIERNFSLGLVSSGPDIPEDIALAAAGRRVLAAHLAKELAPKSLLHETETRGLQQ